MGARREKLKCICFVELMGLADGKRLKLLDEIALINAGPPRVNTGRMSRW